jgi:hypothetical protein
MTNVTSVTVPKLAKTPRQWSPGEARVLRSLRTAERIQRFLDDELAYDLEPDGPRCRSVRVVLRERVGHCMQGALVAAAALEFHAFDVALIDLEAVRDDDHVLAAYRVNGLWGAVAKSNYSGLRSREPVYRTTRELVMSYFEHYYNLRGEKSLRGYSRPVRMSRFGDGWKFDEEDPWYVPEHLCSIPHAPVFPIRQQCLIAKMDRRLYEAGRYGMRKA